MDGAAVAAWLGLAGLFVTAAASMIVKKVRGPEDNAAARRDTIAERDSLIDSFKEDIKSLKEDVKAQKAETAELRREVEAVRDHNNVLINYCYLLVAVIRRHGHEAEIPNPPPNGIHI